MLPKKISIAAIAFLLLLIAFDALQQKYYVDNFTTASKLDYTLFSLFKRHSLRWFLWIIVGIPFANVSWRLIKRNPHQLWANAAAQLLTLIILFIAITLVVITGVSLMTGGLSLDQFQEYFVFFMYQKALVFFMASCTVIIYQFNKAKEEVIQSQYISIKHLENLSHSFRESSLSNGRTIPHMVIKTGNKIHRVLLEDIVWIQSDDYCSKIHTKDERSFTLRKSLKSLESELQSYGFIRIHRSALLNLKSVEQLNLKTSIVRLGNDVELPISKSRLQALKKSLADVSV